MNKAARKLRAWLKVRNRANVICDSSFSEASRLLSAALKEEREARKEKDAKKCDEIARLLRHPHDKTAEECAAAIRRLR